MKKQILALINDESKKADIHDLCTDMTVEFVEMTQSDINRSLAEVLGLPLLKPLEHPLIRENAKAPAMYVAPELIVFNNVDDATLDRFLDEYKSRGIAPVTLKGVVTPTNLTWNIYELIKEYQEESGQK